MNATAFRKLFDELNDIGNIDVELFRYVPQEAGMT